MVERLQCHVKEYAWGKIGSNSEVSLLYAAGHDNFRIDEKKPYAELWMGTHPDGPARIHGSNQKLSTFIAKSSSVPTKLNAKTTIIDDDNDDNDVHLPFIMKIMSIRTTLSLQVHPTKEQANRLHQSDPINYPDRNHKPELAFALTRFELLCGFRPAAQIIRHLQEFTELRQIFGEDNSARLAQTIADGYDQQSARAIDCLERCFLTMMQQPASFVCKQLRSLRERLDTDDINILPSGTIDILRKMQLDFPNDVGCFAPLYLNHMILEPGECCYYAPQEIHAYLSGECVECVGCSNNTIRVALTNKHKDLHALSQVINYRMTDPEYYMVRAIPYAGYPYVDVYSPDCRDFSLHQIKITASNSIIPLPILDCASVMVVVSGVATIIIDGNNRSIFDRSSLKSKECTIINRGDIFYIPAHIELRLSIGDNNFEFLAYRTFSYEVGPDHSNRLLQPKSVSKSISVCDTFSANNDSQLFDMKSDMDGFC